MGKKNVVQQKLLSCVALALVVVGGAACSNASDDDDDDAAARDQPPKHALSATVPVEDVTVTGEMPAANSVATSRNAIEIVNLKLNESQREIAPTHLGAETKGVATSMLGEILNDESDESTPKPAKELDDVGTDWWQW